MLPVGVNVFFFFNSPCTNDDKGEKQSGEILPKYIQYASMFCDMYKNAMQVQLTLILNHDQW